MQYNIFDFIADYGVWTFVLMVAVISVIVGPAYHESKEDKAWYRGKFDKQSEMGKWIVSSLPWHKS